MINAIPDATALQLFAHRGLAAAAGIPGSTEEAAAATTLRDNPFYSAIYKEAQAMFKIQPNKPLPAGLDPQDNSEQDTFSLDELYKLADRLLQSSDPKDARDLSMLLWMAFTCGRGDDARPRKLPELTEPKQRSSIGESAIARRCCQDMSAAAVLFVQQLCLLLSSHGCC